MADTASSETARARRKELAADIASEVERSSSLSSLSVPLLFPTSDNAMAGLSDDGFPDSVAGSAGRETRSMRKRKSSVISDGDSSDPEVVVKPAKKKPGPKPKPKASSDFEDSDPAPLKPLKKRNQGQSPRPPKPSQRQNRKARWWLLLQSRSPMKWR
ncbi:hypothetical protein B0H11DRAFT_1905196 [Mycena galericulata]|nr:hypothetical protein B0H11DRAFT_1905196 [Mycena galericulata]